MITRIEYIQLKAFARQGGLILGLIWIVTFGGFIASLTMPYMQLLFITGILSTPYAAYKLLCHYRDNVLTGTISFRRAFAYTLTIAIYASIIIAAATFIYFYLFDQGRLLGSLMSSIQMPEMQAAFTEAGVNLKEVETQMQTLANARPIDFAFSIFFDGLFSAPLLAAIAAFFGKKSK